MVGLGGCGCEWAWALVKWAALVFALVLLYVLHVMVLKPYLFYRKYKQYPNVKSRESFLPILGDIKEHVDCMKNNGAHYVYMKNRADEFNKYDLRAKLDGVDPNIMIQSNKALEEFVSMQGTKIDKIDTTVGPSAVILKSIITNQSSPEVMRRKKSMLSWLALNSASRYILDMIKCIERVCNDMKNRKEADLIHEMNVFTFDVFSDILFGDDVKELVTKLYPYENPDGTTEMIELREILIRLLKAYMNHIFHPLCYVFTFIKEMGLVNPFKRDTKNRNTFKKAIFDIVKNSKEQKTAYHIFNDPIADEETKLDEVCAILVAGSETTSHSLVACCYFLNKYPDTLKKLRQELQENGLGKGANFAEACTMEKIQSLTYLNCCVKEALRCDIVLAQSFSYSPKEDIQICNVPIPKGTQIRIDLVSSHFDSDKWLDEYEFIPERHDLESEYFAKLKQSGKKPETYSRRSFSHGMRKCPGQTFAMLEMKVAIAYIVTHLDLKFKEEDLQNENIGFGLGSHLSPIVEVQEL
ncbi:unnamed protein product [Moneuplotes crassus]|uniref:Cytochrome P450 n=1 Tax=Euplotes crassus TaxID=5936 RepID=A0AAD1UJC8_EUPCR|nr:unnamed protein product [Moneuplotes crassus]